MSTAACYYFANTGHCSLPICPFSHDEKDFATTECVFYMHSGNCPFGDKCKLSHQKIQEKESSNVVTSVEESKDTMDVETPSETPKDTTTIEPLKLKAKPRYIKSHLHKPCTKHFCDPKGCHNKNCTYSHDNNFTADYPCPLFYKNCGFCFVENCRFRHDMQDVVKDTDTVEMVQNKYEILRRMHDKNSTEYTNKLIEVENLNNQKRNIEKNHEIECRKIQKIIEEDKFENNQKRQTVQKNQEEILSLYEKIAQQTS
jgi:hypothetical protein